MDYQKWHPDLIYFDNHRAFGSACYHVQKLFMNHHGDDLLYTETENFAQPQATKAPISGRVVIVPTKAVAQYRNIEMLYTETGQTNRLLDVIAEGQSLIPIVSDKPQGYGGTVQQTIQ